MTTRFTRMILAALLLTVVLATAGYGAAGGSQTVTVTAAQQIDISVPGGPVSVGGASVSPGACGTGSTLINVKSNKSWNLQIRSEPVTYPTGRAKNGSGVAMVNQLGYLGGDVASYTSISATYASLYAAAQAKTSSRNVSVSYQQCVDYLDDPGTYTIVVEYLGLQF